MQALVYSFILVAALGVGATAYFGLTFTPIDAILAMVVFAGVCVLIQERILRRRAEARLEQSLETLSQLVATDTQAGAAIGQRLNRLADENAGKRLDMLEADISVLGTVIRQVAEAVADIESKRLSAAAVVPEPTPAAPPTTLIVEPMAPPPPKVAPEPALSPEKLRRAVDDDRLVIHLQPVVTLPQRRPVAYDIVPRLLLDGGELLDIPPILPQRGEDETLRRIDGEALIEAITFARRSRINGQSVRLNIPLNGATLADRDAGEQLLAAVDANRALAESFVVMVPEAQLRDFGGIERGVLEQLARKGVGLALSGVNSLRFDAADFAAQGIGAVRIDAVRFTTRPDIYTDLHRADVAGYLRRFGIDIVATGVTGEREILELLEDGITLVQGNHIAAPAPARSETGAEPARDGVRLRRVEL